MAGIKLMDIHKQYKVEGRDVQVLRGISLDIPEDRITVILGRSGCGKTTLLRLTGGLEKADSGEIEYEASHRTAFVFQEPRLMPWLTVWDNVTFGIRKKEKNRENIRGIIRTVGLEGFEKSIPVPAFRGNAAADSHSQGTGIPAFLHYDGRAFCRPGLFHQGTDAERAFAGSAETAVQHTVCDSPHR